MKTIIFTSNDIDQNNWILVAITDLDTQKIPNYGATAKKYDLVRINLWRKYTSQTIIRNKAIIKF